MSTYTVSTESRGFLLGTVIATSTGLALTITNSIYYSQARNNCNSISTTTANVMMWLNIILAVIFGIILIWAIYRLVVHPELRKELGKQTSDYFSKPPKGPITNERVGITNSGKVVTTKTPVKNITNNQTLPLYDKVPTSSGVSGNVITKGASNLDSSSAL